MQEPKVDCVVALEVRCLRQDGTECATIELRDTNCLEPLFYTIETCNVGEVMMTIGSVEIDFNGQVNDLTLDIPENPLPAGRCTTVTPRYEGNVCVEAQFSANVQVNAAPLNGSSCTASQKVDFAVDDIQIEAPTRTPQQVASPTFQGTMTPSNPVQIDCVTDVTLACALEDETDCAQVVARTTDCAARLFYRIQVCNPGQVELELIEAEFSVNGNVTPFVGQLQNRVPTGECTVATPAIDVDLCNAIDLTILASVVGNSPSGNQCQDGEQLIITVEPLTP